MPSAQAPERLANGPDAGTMRGRLVWASGIFRVRYEFFPNRGDRTLAAELRALEAEHRAGAGNIPHTPACRRLKCSAKTQFAYGISVANPGIGRTAGSGLGSQQGQVVLATQLPAR